MHAAYPGEASVLTAAERGMLKTFASLCSQACLHEDRRLKFWNTPSGLERLHLGGTG